MYNVMHVYNLIGNIVYLKCCKNVSFVTNKAHGAKQSLGKYYYRTKYMSEYC